MSVTLDDRPERQSGDRVSGPAKLRSWLEAHLGEAVCDGCMAAPHAEHGCGRSADLPVIEAKRLDKPLYDLRHVQGLIISTERGVCPKHGRRSHYRLTGSGAPTKVRASLTDANRDAVGALSESENAFTGATTERGQVRPPDPSCSHPRSRANNRLQRREGDP